jgi:hypothetical protein
MRANLNGAAAGHLHSVNDTKHSSLAMAPSFAFAQGAQQNEAILPPQKRPQSEITPPEGPQGESIQTKRQRLNAPLSNLKVEVEEQRVNDTLPTETRPKADEVEGNIAESSYAQ